MANKTIVFNSHIGHFSEESYNNREYFTLGGCCGTERPIHMSKLQ